MPKYFVLLVVAVMTTGSLWAQSAKKKTEPGIYDLNRIVEVRLYFDDPRWADHLDSLKNAGGEERLTGTLVLDKVRYEQVGVRYKGNSSFNSVRNDGSDKLPLNIKVNHIVKTQTLPGGFETLKLSNVFRDPSFLREVLSYEIARDYLPAPRANFARVFVNDQYLGLYNSSESIDDHFLGQYFGSTTGTLVKGDPIWKDRHQAGCPEGDNSSLQYLGEDSLCYVGLYEMKSDSGWAELIQLARILNQQPGELETVLDVDQTLWMLAFNNVLVNLDSYTGIFCHNYYLFADTFGVFHPLVWDMNLSFGGFRFAEKQAPMTNLEMQELSPFVHFRNEKRPLIMQLLANTLYRKMYVAHLRTILHDHFTNGRYRERARAVQQLIDPHVKGDTAKLYSYEAFQQNLDTTAHVDDQDIVGITELMEKRIAYLSHHPLLTAEAPRITKVWHEKGKEKVTVAASVAAAEKCWVFFRNPDGIYQHVEMTRMSPEKPATEVNWSEAKGEESQWTAVLELKKGARYYVVAEGSRSATLSPERASHDYYTVE